MSDSSPQQQTTESPKRQSPEKSSESPQKQPMSPDTLDSHFASFASRVEKIDQDIDVNDMQSLIAARDNLAEIIIELEKLHVDELDIASNTQDEDDSKRFKLTKEISNLLHQTQQLYEVLDSSIRRIQGIESPQRANKDEGDSGGAETPLAREEIAKLLLLVARAHSIGQISDTQKSNLKMEVCQRKHYLRAILRQQDITQVMTALSQIGGGN